MDKTVDVLIEFLKENPKIFVSRKKVNRPDPKTRSGQLKIRERITASLERTIEPTVPTTIPDPLVSLILNDFYAVDKEKLEVVALEHQYSMAAEDAIGDFLEEYINSIAKNYGWHICAGEIVKATDFIKKETNCWRLFQIKNRSNSENSSSKAIRKKVKDDTGLEITPWFRTFSRTGKTNWESFPDDRLKKILNEEDFQMYVKNCLSKLKEENKKN